MISVLEQEYVEPIRPYSKKELEELREQYLKTLNISSNRVYHRKCNHFYNVKINSRKEKKIKLCFTEENVDIGNCSICWKLYRTPFHVKHIAMNLVESYINELYDESSTITYEKNYIEKSFYTWLYEKVND